MRRVRPAEIGLAVGAIAAAALVLAAIRHPGAAAQAWLAAWLFWVGLPVGGLFLILVHGMVGGSWGGALRVSLRDLVGLLPPLALFLIPILIGGRLIYPWARAGETGWLMPPFVAARAVAYVAAWGAIALAASYGRRTDGSLPGVIAWPCLIVLFATTSLAAFDWIMSLEPHWTSTIYGLLVTTGWALAGLAAAILLDLLRGTADEPARLDALARLLLALVVLWAYLSAIQLIVIWESDLSHDIGWLLRRRGGWGVVAAGFATFEFIIPFLLLLWRPMRRAPGAVGLAAMSVLAAHLAETWWLAVPDFGRPFGWGEPVAAVAIGGCLLFFVARAPAAWRLETSR
jgi:hypothetical protein